MTRWARRKASKDPEDGSQWEHIKSPPIELSNRKRGKILKQKANSDSQINAAQRVAIKKNKRSDNRRLKRQRRKNDKMVCFHCRMPGHGMADCPTLLQDNEQGTGICFKCGSTEHKSHSCTAKLQPGKEYCFAKCFICGEEGHLSKTCPDNPRGLYPNGGCCKLCGSVDHYKQNCPERQIKGEVTAYRLPIYNSLSNNDTGACHVSIDDEIALYESDTDSKKPNEIPKKPKVVKF